MIFIASSFFKSSDDEDIKREAKRHVGFAKIDDTPHYESILIQSKIWCDSYQYVHDKVNNTYSCYSVSFLENGSYRRRDSLITSFIEHNTRKKIAKAFIALHDERS